MIFAKRGALVLAAALVAAMPATAEETPKRGGVLTFMIPADAPPSFGAQREETYATIHSAAPFYSTLIRANPMDPGSPDLVCDLCTEMPQPTDGGKTYTFKIRPGVKFHDGQPLTAADVLASWNKIIFPPEGIVSPRQSNFVMVDKIEAPDPSTIVFKLKFATDAFLPALTDPYAWIYSKAKLDKDIHWYEKNIDGSGPFKFVAYETGQSIEGARNPDYYHQGLPYLDGFKGIFADKQATRVDAIRSDRAAVEFRGFPPTVRDELKQALGDKVAVQTSDWNCGGLITPNHKKKPFDDPRVRRALTLALDRWHTAPDLSKIALVRTVGGVTFPGSPLAPSKEELQQDRRQGDPEGAAGRAVVCRAALGGFRCDRRGQLPECRQPARRCRQIPAAYGIGVELRQFRGRERGQDVQRAPARARQVKAEGTAPRIREIRARRTGARHLPAVVAAHRAIPILRQGLEDRPEPLREPGSRNRVAR